MVVRGRRLCVGKLAKERLDGRRKIVPSPVPPMSAAAVEYVRITMAVMQVAGRVCHDR